VRTRATFLIRLGTGLLACGLAAGVTVAGSRVALEDERDLRAAPTSARTDGLDAPGSSALTQVRDPFDSERGARRVDLATLAAALLLAAGGVWWAARPRDDTRIFARRPLVARPRAPPRPPALVDS